jgi:hypothetical protein
LTAILKYHPGWLAGDIIAERLPGGISKISEFKRNNLLLLPRKVCIFMKEFQYFLSFKLLCNIKKRNSVVKNKPVTVFTVMDYLCGAHIFTQPRLKRDYLKKSLFLIVKREDMV